VQVAGCRLRGSWVLESRLQCSGLRVQGQGFWAGGFRVLNTFTMGDAVLVSEHAAKGDISFMTRFVFVSAAFSGSNASLPRCVRHAPVACPAVDRAEYTPRLAGFAARTSTAAKGVPPFAAGCLKDANLHGQTVL